MSKVQVRGETAATFARVADAFEMNFHRDDDYEEVGAALCVYMEGEQVVNLWGGLRAPEGPAWTDDTLVNVWSTTKGLTAVLMARLVERGLIDYEAPIIRYWPEFGQAGKDAIRVIDILSHQSGLNGFLSPTTIGDFADWDLLTSRLAEQPPFWAPGSHASYHAMTYGFLAGEVARRVTGLTPRELFQVELAHPLGADLYLGIPQGERGRLAPIIEPATWSATPGVVDVVAEPATVNPAPRPDWANREDWRDGQVPAANGHASADGLARVYGALANDGVLGEIRLLSKETISDLRKPRWQTGDRMLGPRAWAAGMALNVTGIWGPNPATFGHSGWGGSFGCADPDARIGIGYVMNRMSGKVADDPRAQALCSAIFKCLRS